MKKLLLIDAQTARAKLLLEQLAPAGFEVLLADSSLYALTMLEHQRPDLVVIHDEVDDMPSHELCALIKQDAVLSDVVVVLLGAPTAQAPRAQTVAGFDLVVPEAEITTLAARLAALPEANPRAQPEPPTAPQGGTGDLETLISDSTAGLKTGLLRVSSEDAGSHFLVFDNGELVHAVYGTLHGERALARMLYEHKRTLSMGARFEPISRSGIAAWPRSIAPAQRQHLLDLHLHYDESRTMEIRPLDLKKGL